MPEWDGMLFSAAAAGLRRPVGVLGENSVGALGGLWIAVEADGIKGG